jgi:hypothetical protein
LALDLLSVYLPITATVLACGFAMLKGDTPERNGALILFVGWVSGTLVAWQRLGPITTNIFFGMDIVVLATLAALAWSCRKAWTIVASLSQALQIIVHVARDLGVKIDDVTYYNTLGIAGYGLLLALAVGTAIAWRERAALASFGIVDQSAANSPASARSTSSSARPTPKIATKHPKRGPWF